VRACAIREARKRAFSPQPVNDGHVDSEAPVKDPSVPNEDFDLGKRLRELREERGLTQRDLAKKGGVPHGMISMIERGRTNPSVTTLRKILEGIDMTMGEFFEPEIPSGTLQKFFFMPAELVDLTAHLGQRHGRQLSRLVSVRQVGDARRHGLQILHETYEPGADCDMNLKHPVSTGGFVLSGELEVTVGGQRRVLKAGDSFLFDGLIHHRFRNVSDRPAVLITASTPAYM